MTVLVTGGSGYIGSHVVRLLQAGGYSVAIVDEIVPKFNFPEESFLQLNLATEAATPALAEFIQRQGIDSVIHFAARKQVGESVERPVYYYRENIGGLVNLLDAMTQHSVTKLVFSSSAAVYGNPIADKASETDLQQPINPYGETKSFGENLIRAVKRSSELNAVSLRYFNVAGAGWADLRDPYTLNLVPIVLAKLAAGQTPVVFGDDYDTPDGSCVRDYVHVLDLAEAHIRALEYLAIGVPQFDVFNVGTGEGNSVFEVLDTIRRVNGLDFDHIISERRAGDPAVLVADTSRIQQEFSWQPSHNLSDIIESAWRYQ